MFYYPTIFTLLSVEYPALLYALLRPLEASNPAENIF